MHIPLAETSLKRLKLGVMIPTARRLSVATAMMLEHLAQRFEELAAIDNL